MIKIELPWPDPILSPNKRPHWVQKAKAAKKARSDAFKMTPSAVTLGGCENAKHGPAAFASVPNYRYKITLCPPDKRRRDDDNAEAACKPYRDGICDKLGINDFQLYPSTRDWGEVVKGGKVIVEIGALT